jgi:hypothetical protein
MVDYAKSRGGIWMMTTAFANKNTCKPMRFLTDGQGSRKNPHNAILWWNQNGFVFQHNICPYYEERHDHGLENITHQDCQDLGLGYIILLDKHFSS